MGLNKSLAFLGFTLHCGEDKIEMHMCVDTCIHISMLRCMYHGGGS